MVGPVKDKGIFQGITNAGKQVGRLAGKFAVTVISITDMACSKIAEFANSFFSKNTAAIPTHSKQTKTEQDRTPLNKKTLDEATINQINRPYDPQPIYLDPAILESNPEAMLSSYTPASYEKPRPPAEPHSTILDSPNFDLDDWDQISLIKNKIIENLKLENNSERFTINIILIYLTKEDDLKKPENKELNDAITDFIINNRGKLDKNKFVQILPEARKYLTGKKQTGLNDFLHRTTFVQNSLPKPEH
jgi:hypothetical protein